MNTCKKHSRYNCWDPECQRDNAGEISVGGTGIGIGIGGGMTIDPSDGSLGMNIGGINFDFDGK
jgi:hypothetical protein